MKFNRQYVTGEEASTARIMGRTIITTGPSQVPRFHLIHDIIPCGYLLCIYTFICAVIFSHFTRTVCSFLNLQFYVNSSREKLEAFLLHSMEGGLISDGVLAQDINQASSFWHIREVHISISL